jgi:hypothetical protein
VTPEQRRRRARIAAHACWARTAGRTARTSSGTQAFLDRFERQVDPDRVLSHETRETMAMARHARTAYTLQLAESPLPRDGAGPSERSLNVRVKWVLVLHPGAIVVLAMAVGIGLVSR